MKKLISLIVILTLSLSSVSFARSAEEIAIDVAVQHYEKQDYDRAAELFKIAADDGNAFAQFSLGYMYRKGQGVKQNYALAVKWLTKSAKQGRDYAQKELGDMYFIGLGVKKSKTKAIYWLSESARNGNEEAKKVLDKLGVKVKKGKETSKSDDPFSNVLLAYSGGNYKQAFKLGIKAVKTIKNNEGNIAWLQNMLADLYYYGDGVKKDYAKSCKWRIKAEKSPKGFNFDANVDLTRFPAHLGICYYYGQGVKKSKKTGIKWFKKSARDGNQYAKDFLNERNIKY